MNRPTPIVIVESPDRQTRRVALVRPDIRPPCVARKKVRHGVSAPDRAGDHPLPDRRHRLALTAIFFNAPLEGIANPSDASFASALFSSVAGEPCTTSPVVAGVVLPGLVVLALVVHYARINLTAGPLWEGSDASPGSGVATALLALLRGFRLLGHVIPTLLTAGRCSSRGGGGVDASGRRRRACRSPTDHGLFVAIASIPTIIGTFFRGPGWSFVCPGPLFPRGGDSCASPFVRGDEPLFLIVCLTHRRRTRFARGIQRTRRLGSSGRRP
jgi:hypothetical protein